MTNCWQNQAEARPSFAALTKQLRDMENQHMVRTTTITTIARATNIPLFKKNLLNFEIMPPNRGDEYYNKHNI